MRLEWLAAERFRCYDSLSFSPAPGINVLVGDNGAGKTSVLEAISYLATTASFRRSPDAALVATGEMSAIIRGGFDAGPSEATVEVEIFVSGPRRALLNGKRLRGRSDLAAVLAVVAFLPDDLDLVKRGPALRREFLDDLAVQLWPAAAVEQAELERVLRQRNALLKRHGRGADATTLDVLDERLAKTGSVVMARRLEALVLAAPEAAASYREMDQQSAALSWEYAGSGVDLVEPGTDREVMGERLHQALTEARQTDMERRLTTVGPQRDEIRLLLDGRDVRSRASQGEQRSIALGLRLAAYRTIATLRSVEPILLLDDVFSELDAERSLRLVRQLPTSQVFITSARPEEVPLSGRTWHVLDGRVAA